MARVSKILYYYLHYLGDRKTDPESSNSLSACTVDGTTDSASLSKGIDFFKKLKSSRAAACKPPYIIRKWTEWLLPAYLCSSGFAIIKKTTGTKILTLPPTHTHIHTL